MKRVIDRQKQIDKILTDYFFPPNLEPDIQYVTTHDDNDGEPTSGMLSVSIDKFGDGWIKTYGPVLRFRTFGGGGRYPKIRNALLVLADAIRQEGNMG